MQVNNSLILSRWPNPIESKFPTKSCIICTDITTQELFCIWNRWARLQSDFQVCRISFRQKAGSPLSLQSCLEESLGLCLQLFARIALSPTVTPLLWELLRSLLYVHWTDQSQPAAAIHKMTCKAWNIRWYDLSHCYAERVRWYILWCPEPIPSSSKLLQAVSTCCTYKPQRQNTLLYIFL